MENQNKTVLDVLLQRIDDKLTKQYIYPAQTFDEDEYLTRRKEFKRNLLFAFLLISIPALIYYIISKALTANFTDVVTIFAGILVPVIFFFMPTYVNKQIQIIRERIGKNLNSSDKVYHEALDLLKWVGTSPRSKFYYTSATPYFGLYRSFKKDEDDLIDNEWKKLLEERILASTKDHSIETRIYSLKWEPFTSGRSPLFELCKVLSKSCKSSAENRKNALDIYDKSISHWSDFCHVIQKAPKSKTKIFISNTKHEVFAFWAEKDDQVRSAFAIVAEGCEHFKMFGSSSVYDELWTAIAKNALDSRQINSIDITNLLIEDKRTKKQVTRDAQLLRHFTNLSDNNPIPIVAHEKNKPEYKLTNGVVLEYTINKYVFPFEIAKCSELWPEALDQIKSVIGDRKSVGIDINTGSGILAIHLSTICDHVFATENDSKAMGNAILNYNSFKQKASKTFEKQSDILFYCCDNIDNLPLEQLIETANSSKQNLCFIVTIQYLFYDSFFCTMDYKYTYSNQSCNELFNSEKQLPKKNKLESIIQSINNKLRGDVYVILPLNTELVTNFNVMNILGDKHFTNVTTLVDKSDNTSTLLIFYKHIIA